jgi:hypothetical protein
MRILKNFNESLILTGLGETGGGSGPPQTTRKDS